MNQRLIHQLRNHLLTSTSTADQSSCRSRTTGNPSDRPAGPMQPWANRGRGGPPERGVGRNRGGGPPTAGHVEAGKKGVSEPLRRAVAMSSPAQSRCHANSPPEAAPQVLAAKDEDAMGTDQQRPCLAGDAHVCRQRTLGQNHSNSHGQCLNIWCSFTSAPISSVAST